MDEAATAPPELAEVYYLENLEHVIEHALERYSAILAPSERDVLSGFSSLSRDARRLYGRLYLRRGPLFRTAHLRYREIRSLEKAIGELVACGLCADRPFSSDPEAIRPLLELFTADELKSAARIAGVRANGRKSEIVAAVAGSPEAVDQLASKGPVVERLQSETFELAQLLFFGNLGQDLSEFVLVSLERTRYPRYELTRDLPLFASRRELTSFLEAVAFEADEVDAADADRLLTRAGWAISSLAARAPRAPHAWRLDPLRYYSRAAFGSARALERLGFTEAALEIYCGLVTLAPQGALRAESADRLGLAEARAGVSGRFEEAAGTLLADPSLDGIARHLVERRAARMAGPGCRAGALRSPPIVELFLRPAGHSGTKALYESSSGDAVTIEEAVLERLGGGLRAENALYRSLFGLLFWNAIFAGVPGMFQHRFQTAPLDLGSEAFFTNRRELIQTRLRELETSDFALEVRRAWDEHEGESNAFVTWSAYTVDQLEDAARSFGRRLIPLLERIAQNPKRHGRGLPDLLVYESGAPVMVEVKGPGDQPQIEQRLWHDALLRMGLDVRIARVRRVVPSAESPDSHPGALLEVVEGSKR